MNIKYQLKARKIITGLRQELCVNGKNHSVG